MGRKSIAKPRVQNPEKRRELATHLLPSLKGGGISKLTMDDIAQRLGRSKATIYKYFESREELFDLALTEKLEQIGGFVPILGNQDDPYVDRYHNGLSHLSESLVDVSAQFLGDVQRDFPQLWEKISQFRDMATMVLRNFYQEGLDKGIINEVHTGILVLSDQILFGALLDQSFLEANGLSLGEAFEHYFQMKFYGLLKDK